MIRRLLLNKENREKTAVIDGEKNILYRDLAEKACAIQQHLPPSKAVTIAIYLPNGADYIAALFGTLMYGMTAFPLNALMTKNEMIPLLEQAATYAVITSKRFDPLFKDIQASYIPHLQVIYMEELQICEHDDLPTAADIGTDEPMVLLSTSGTTARARIVQLSERNVEASVLGYLDKIDFGQTNTDDVRYVLATPFSSAYGLMILSACLIKSFPIVLLKEDFTLDALYKTAQEHKVTHYEGGAVVPLLMEQTAGRPIPYDIHLLKYFGFGGSKISGNTLRVLLTAYPGVNFWQGYGMTEAAPLITKHTTAKLEQLEKIESVGTAIKGMKIAVEADGVITDAPYTTGEIVVKGPNVMLGYYENEAETNKALKSGYLYTGDIGYLDEDGYLYICGRKKSIIIIRGLNVYPEEVEACLLNSLLVKDCFVYGDTDAFGNEMICADIVPADSRVHIDQIKAYCSAHLSSYKQPQKIQMVSAIKKAASGKTARVVKDKQ